MGVRLRGRRRQDTRQRGCPDEGAPRQPPGRIATQWLPEDWAAASAAARPAAPRREHTDASQWIPVEPVATDWQAGAFPGSEAPSRARRSRLPKPIGTAAAVTAAAAAVIIAGVISESPHSTTYAALAPHGARLQPTSARGSHPARHLERHSKRVVHSSRSGTIGAPVMVASTTTQAGTSVTTLGTAPKSATEPRGSHPSVPQPVKTPKPASASTGAGSAAPATARGSGTTSGSGTAGGGSTSGGSGSGSGSGSGTPSVVTQVQDQVQNLAGSVTRTVGSVVHQIPVP